MKIMKIILVLFTIVISSFWTIKQLIAIDFPKVPVNLTIGYAAGGSTDLISRALSDQLAKNLGGPVVVINKPGSGGMLAAELLRIRRPMDTPYIC